MNILYIERSLDVHSVVYDQIQRVKKHHQVYVLSIDEKKMLHAEGICRVSYYQFPKWEKIKSLFFWRAVKKGLRDHFQGIKFDLIHAHFAYPEGHAARVLSQELDVPFVVTIRGSDLLIYPYQNKFLFGAIKNVLQSAHKLICVSNYLCHKAVEMGAKNGAVTHIPDGFDDTIFCVDEKIVKKNQFVYVGNLIEIKNVNSLLQAFSVFLKTKPDYYLLIIGSGVLRESLQKESERLGIKEAVQFLGQISHMELPLYLNESKALVLPSLSEGWGNVLVEAMACGLPVVGSNIGGIPEIITHDGLGRLIDPKNVEDIAKKMLEVIETNWDVQCIIDNAEQYTKNKSVEKLLFEYNNIIHRK